MCFNTDVLHCLFFPAPSIDTCIIEAEWKQSVFFLDKCKLLYYPANINFFAMFPEDTYNRLIKLMLPENTYYVSCKKKPQKTTTLMIFLHGSSPFLSLGCCLWKKKINLKLKFSHVSCIPSYYFYKSDSIMEILSILS